MEAKVASSLSTNVDNVLAVKSGVTVDCAMVKVFFLGMLHVQLVINEFKIRIK